MGNAKSYDVIVIGGGPAGMFAAGVAGEQGAKVLLLEKNDRLGKKLLLTGGGRCNITTTENDPRIFVDLLGNNGRFLYSALSVFNCSNTINFFRSRGLSLKIEKGIKVFPSSDKALDVLDILIAYLKESKVHIRTKSQIKNFSIKNGHIEHIICNSIPYHADKYIIATGGLSYPATGSSGDGYKWAESMGHTIVHTRPALMPLIVDSRWVHKLSVTTLSDIDINVYCGEQKVNSIKGDIMFTHTGLVSPEVLNISEEIGTMLRHDKVFIELDLFPELTDKQCDNHILDIIQTSLNKSFRNALSQNYSSRFSIRLIDILLELSSIPNDKKCHSINRSERKILCDLLKGLRIPVSAVAGYEKAIVTAGGISLKEIDPKTMRSKLVDNLYFSGEIIDLHGPTGGYNLQIAWSTGYLAGLSAGKP